MGLAIDGAIILVYFLLVTGIGIYMGRRERSLEDFALGGRRVPWWAVMASIIAAETSAATFLGVPEVGFKTRSLAYMQFAYGLILGRIIVAYMFIKPFYEYRVYTVYDYLGIRFGPLTKGYVSALFLVMRTLASGTRLFIPALVMVLAWKLIVGGSASTSQAAAGTVGEYLVAIVILTVITCAYTAVGGIKAVIWTDVIQAALMFGAAIVAVLTLLYHIGGDTWDLTQGIRKVGQLVPEMSTLSGYVSTGYEPSAIEAWMAKNNVTAMTPWNYVRMTLSMTYALPAAVIAYTVMCVGMFGTDQDMVQRMLTAPDYKKSRRSVITAAVMDLPIFALFALIGVLLYAYYLLHPHHKPGATADVFGAYILNVMPTGIRGLVLAGVFATAMGSLSAALNALATSATNDWYIPWQRRRATRTAGLAPIAAPLPPPVATTSRAETTPPADHPLASPLPPTEIRSSNPQSAIPDPQSDDGHHHVFVARLFTALFALLMIAVAGTFAYANIKHPNLGIIPVVLGVASFIIGPMLGTFLVGFMTKKRGSDTGNVIAITAGLLVIGVLFTLQIPIGFPWYALIGATTVVCISLLFPTPPTTSAHKP